MKGAVWFGLDIGLIARGTATFFLPIAADENAIVRPPPTWSFPLTALKKYREHVVGSVPAPFGADLSPLACSIRTQYISLLQASDPEIFACSWLGLAGRRVCQGPSLTSQQFCPLIPPCRLARRRHFEIPSSAKLRETRDPNYIESRVERFTRNFIRDRPRHSAHIECNDPGIALDRTATEAAIRSSRSSPQSQQREPQSPPGISNTWANRISGSAAKRTPSAEKSAQGTIPIRAPRGRPTT